MNWLVVFVVFAALAANANALFDPTWNTLRVTWGVKIWQGNIFAKMPLKQSDAENEGFVRISENENCSEKFLGNRYYKDSDPALVLLYDVNGYYAGIQTAIPKNKFNPENLTNWYSQAKFFQSDVIDGNETFTLTAYHVDPAIICTTGRTESQFRQTKSGTQLSVQTGSNPLTDTMSIPSNENEIEGTAWTQGKCFRTMGMHYWYNLTLDMNCDEFRPMFLLYNRGKLTGFGWATMGYHSFSNRYEHPPKDVLAKFLNPVPNCLNTLYDQYGGFSTMHVYMNTNPVNMLC